MSEEGFRCASCGHFIPIGKTATKLWPTFCSVCGGELTHEVPQRVGLFRKLFRKGSEPQPKTISATAGKITREDETLLDLCSLRFSNDRRATDDEVVFSHARALLSRLQYQEAEEVARTGLSQCSRKDRLCEVLGNIHLNQHRPVGIGWFMQACLLGSPNWVPYLLVSYAAKAVGFEDLAWRCLNACDVLDTGMKRIDDLEISIRGIVLGSDRSELVVALNRFEKAIDSRLPLANEIPRDQYQRSVFLLQNIEGKLEDPPLKQKMRLLGLEEAGKREVRNTESIRQPTAPYTKSSTSPAPTRAPNEPQQVSKEDKIDKLLKQAYHFAKEQNAKGAFETLAWLWDDLKDPLDPRYKKAMELYSRAYCPHCRIVYSNKTSHWLGAHMCAGCNKPWKFR